MTNGGICGGGGAGSAGVSKFWGKISLALTQIFGMAVPKDSRLMILMDFGFFKIPHYRLLLANLLPAVSLLVAKVRKLEESPSMEDWVIKVRFMCLVSKLSAMNSYR